MTLTLETSGELMVPLSARRRAGIKAGDRLEIEASLGVITIRKAAGDDTPEQRRIIKARLAEAEEDIRQGRVSGPFDTHEEFMNSLRAAGKKTPTKSKSTKRR